MRRSWACGLSRSLSLVLLLAVWAGVAAPWAVRAAPRTDIAIAQTEAEAAGIQIDQAHIFIAPSGDSLQIAEYYLIGNSGTSDYVGTLDEGREVPTTIAFELPADATNVAFDGAGLGERFVGDEHRFADTLPVPPGTATLEVGFSYALTRRDELELARSVDVPVASVVLIVSGQGIGLAGPSLTFTGDIETRMGPAASYIAGPLEAGMPLAVRLVSREVTGTTQPSVGGSATTMGASERSARERNAGGEIALGVVALVAAGSAVAWAWSRSLLPMPESVRATIEEIVALDLRYEQGQLEDGAYHRERAALARGVRRLIQREG
jgi:hypothetical protein